MKEADRVTLAHGGGGRAMGRLLREQVAPAVGAAALRHDGAVLDLGGARVALTTDGFVVTPLFFPGGDIGRLAVFGTLNDLLVTGAQPQALSLAMILEEGLEFGVLGRVLAAVRQAAAEAGVPVVTGDTKVVERGKGDQVYLTTTGVGLVPAGREVGAWRARPGDALLVSGDVGRHGAAILAAREGLGFEGLESDCAPLLAPCHALWESGADVRFLRDPTRGGLGAALAELAAGAGAAIAVEEDAVPLSPPVRALCEVLGLDPLLLACEGRLLAAVPEADADRALAALRSVDPAASCIGTLRPGRGQVWLRDAFGGERLLDLPLGEALPRIC